jgi:hypothetical protein
VSYSQARAPILKLADLLRLNATPRYLLLSVITGRARAVRREPRLRDSATRNLTNVHHIAITASLWPDGLACRDHFLPRGSAKHV